MQKTTSLKNDTLADPLGAFFASFPKFDYHRTAECTQEFYRMCDFFDWHREDSDRQDAHKAFKTALVKQFNALYGTEVDDIESWRGLCRALNIFPLPEKAGEARKACHPPPLELLAIS